MQNIYLVCIINVSIEEQNAHQVDDSFEVRCCHICLAKCEIVPLQISVKITTFSKTGQKWKVLHFCRTSSGKQFHSYTTPPFPRDPKGIHQLSYIYSGAHFLAISSLPESQRRSFIQKIFTPSNILPPQPGNFSQVIIPMNPKIEQRIEWISKTSE